MTHTPGPWKTLKVDDEGYVSSPDGKDIAITSGGIIAEVFYRIDDDIFADVEANACLIAVAPALLEALRTLVNNLPVPEIELARSAWGNTNTACVLLARMKAVKAIALAEGKDN